MQCEFHGRTKVDNYSFTCFPFLLAKSYSRSHDFHHEKSSVNQREAFWKKLLSIINTIRYNKRHNFTSLHSTKKFIWSFRSSSWKGRAHQSGFFRRGSVGKELVLAALSLGMTLCMMEHSPGLSASPHPHLKHLSPFLSEPQSPHF